MAKMTKMNQRKMNILRNAEDGAQCQGKQGMVMPSGDGAMKEEMSVHRMEIIEKQS